MHDNTNVRMMAASDPELQRLLYSVYYGGCVAKGGITTQQCGWQQAIELMAGAIGDSKFVDASFILEMQQEFAASDLTCLDAFINIFDRGYRVLLAARKAGGQRCFSQLSHPVIGISVHKKYYIRQRWRRCDQATNEPYEPRNAPGRSNEDAPCSPSILTC